MVEYVHECSAEIEPTRFSNSLAPGLPVLPNCRAADGKTPIHGVPFGPMYVAAVDFNRLFGEHVKALQRIQELEKKVDGT